MGLGKALVETCIARAGAGSDTRILTLWTQENLGAARRICRAAASRRQNSPHRSFGHDLVGETWTLDLS